MELEPVADSQYHVHRMTALLAPAVLSLSLWLNVTFLDGESSVVQRWQNYSSLL